MQTQVRPSPFAEEAVKVEPSNPRLHGNLGITYYKMEEFDKAINSLGLAVRGGMTENNIAVEGIPLDYGRVEEYYWYYGFALTRNNRCAEAVPVFRSLITGVPNDEIAVYNANEGLIACQQGGGATSTPAADTTTPEGQMGTPEPNTTPPPQ